VAPIALDGFPREHSLYPLLKDMRTKFVFIKMTQEELLPSFDSKFISIPSFKYVEFNRLISSPNLIAIFSDSSRFLGTARINEITEPIKYAFTCRVTWQVVCDLDHSRS